MKLKLKPLPVAASWADPDRREGMRKPWLLIRAFSFVKVDGVSFGDVGGESHQGRELQRKRSEGDGKIKEVGVYLFCSFFSHPPLFVLLKKN